MLASARAGTRCTKATLRISTFWLGASSPSIGTSCSTRLPRMSRPSPELIWQLLGASPSHRRAGLMGGGPLSSNACIPELS
eukprot:8280903-Alexandrium_andersonii.AAC.1